MKKNIKAYWNFFLINIYPGASNLVELVQMEPWHNTKTKILKH